MGLDMYLSARKYISQVNWRDVPEGTTEEEMPNYWTAEYQEIAGHFPKGLVKHAESGASIDINVAYWRKANQIHGWFVKHVQDNTDDCKSYYVWREQLVTLLDTVKKVLDSDKSVAKELLPVTSGFFFGNYSEDDGYGEYYYAQLRKTETMLKDILVEVEENNTEYEFSYQSSW